jgi:cyanophycin synthetase
MIGFSNGIKQATQKISLVLPISKKADTKNIDLWLKKAFDIKVDDKQSLACTPRNSDEANLLELTVRIMHLANTLLQSIRVPTFAIGKVLSISITPNQNQACTVACVVPYVHHTSQGVYKLAYQTASKVVMSLSSLKHNKKNSDEIFLFLEREYIKKFHKNSFGGESTIPVLKAAWQNGIDFRHIGNGSYVLGLGVNRILMNCGAIQSDSAIGARISKDKWVSASYLRDAGLPAPTHFKVNSIKSSEAIANQLGWPLVVKPLDRDRGEGVTVNINNVVQLSDAIQKALKLSKQALVEKQVVGICHRILVVNGKVRIAAKRLPKSVKGDGKKTVRQLVALANLAEHKKPPWSRLKPFLLDELALHTLASKNLSLDSIPVKDAFVPLRPIQTSEWGGVVENCFDTIHPENAAIAIRAAALFGLSIAGIDIISNDITKPWYENGAIINEVNFSPLLSGTTSEGLIESILEEVIPNKGKIPIEVFIGDEFAWEKAKELQLVYAKEGKHYCLTTDTLTIAWDGKEIPFLGSNLFMRCSAMLFDKQVEGLLVVIQNNALLKSGLPFQHIDRIHHLIDADENTPKSAKLKTDDPWRERMHALLNEYALKH